MRKNYRWTVALLLFIVGSINYMDRAAIGVLAPFIQKSFTLTGVGALGGWRSR